MVKYKGYETGITAAELKQIRKRFPIKKKINGVQCELMGRYTTRRMANENAKEWSDLFGTKIIAIEKRIDGMFVNGVTYEVWGVNTPEHNKRMKELRKSIRRVN
jgi:hypothetical protein